MYVLVPSHKCSVSSLVISGIEETIQNWHVFFCEAQLKKGFGKGLTQIPSLNFRPYYVVVLMRQKSSKPDAD